MRLIDADKLKIDICYARSLNKVESIYDYSYSEKQIQNAPTIKAISIEFLVKTIPEYAKRYGSVYRAVIGNLIEDWEKENDKGSE